MGTKYHYDKYGNYRGKTSDNPPFDNGWIVIAIALFMLMFFIQGC
jgi:hypothetical protein